MPTCRPRWCWRPGLAACHYRCRAGHSSLYHLWALPSWPRPEEGGGQGHGGGSNIGVGMGDGGKERGGTCRRNEGLTPSHHAHKLALTWQRQRRPGQPAPAPRGSRRRRPPARGKRARAPAGWPSPPLPRQKAPRQNGEDGTPCSQSLLSHARAARRRRRRRRRGHAPPATQPLRPGRPRFSGCRGRGRATLLGGSAREHARAGRESCCKIEPLKGICTSCRSGHASRSLLAPIPSPAAVHTGSAHRLPGK
eukprot:363283-Chlamydomonas_euryale.AAC.5